MGWVGVQNGVEPSPFFAVPSCGTRHERCAHLSTYAVFTQLQGGLYNEVYTFVLALNQVVLPCACPCGVRQCYGCCNITSGSSSGSDIIVFVMLFLPSSPPPDSLHCQM